MESHCRVTNADGELRAIGPDPWGCMATGVVGGDGGNRPKPALLGEEKNRVSCCSVSDLTVNANLNNNVAVGLNTVFVRLREEPTFHAVCVLLCL